MCTKTEQTAPQDTADALGMITTGLAFLSDADLHALGISGQQEILAGLGAVTAQTSAVHAAALAAFDAVGGPEADGCKNATAWLHHRNGMTKAAARGASKDSKVQAAHPVIADALAAGDISDSFAKLITRWTSKLPEDLRRESDCILITAAVHGCGEHELNILGAKLVEEYKKTRPDEDETDPFTDRHLQLDETIDGAGKLRADLTPQATAALRAILDSLGKTKGPDDDRTAGQRHHDALQAALEMLLAAGGLPQRHGSATHAEVLMSFADLRGTDGASALEDAWLHSHTPGAPVFLAGTAAQGAACDATLIPVVTGCPDWAAVEEIIQIVLAAHGRPHDDEDLRLAVARRCLDFVSGPGGAASMLRRGLLDGPFAAPSLPLDIGYSETIPPHIRKAVILRDRHCAWPGGCDEPPQRCDVHHLIPKSQGGTTSLANCALFCKFHHLIAIHTWGWTVKLRPGGAWEARSPDGNTVYRSHAPPRPMAA